MLVRSLGAIVVIALTSGASAPVDAQALTGFDAYVAQAVREWRVPGLAIAVVKDGRIVFANGYGVRELGKPSRVDTSTMFAAASTTKAMTAAALGLLVDEGKLSWDDRVTRHLTGFELYDPYVTRELTIRDLLTHRAGLGNADMLWYESDHTLGEVVRRSRWVKPAYSLRSGFIYQNVMYAVAGEVAAAASRMRWEQLVTQRIFAPAGMRNTVATLAQTGGRRNVASPHDIINDTVRVIENASVDAAAPAGSVWTTAADMARWMIFLLDSTRTTRGVLLKPQTLNELFRPQVIVPPGEFYPTARLTRPQWTTYALGWFQHDYRGRKLDFHTGSIDGLVAIVGLMRDERAGVVVLANLDHAEVRHALMYRAFDQLLGMPLRDWSRDLRQLYAARRTSQDSARRAMEARRIPGTRPSLPLESYVGIYGDSLFGPVVVRNDRGRLRISASTRLTGTLEHWHYDTFRARWDKPWQGTWPAVFTIGMEGRPTSLILDGYALPRAAQRAAR